MNRIQPYRKSIRELLSNVKYDIDFYQREYAWKRLHVEDLLNDLHDKFIASYLPQHDRAQVESYPHYFLGAIITVKENGQAYIVDGQQRLTTLTLLLIYIHHMFNDDDIRRLIFSKKYGERSFNINVPERVGCMQALFDGTTFDATEHPDLSVRSLVARYEDIQELFPDSLKDDDVLPYFVDWLIDNVDLVEIETYTNDDAFTIFETMNDRGLSLGQSDMLKGYLLANINSYQQKTDANDLWKKRIVEFVNIGTETNTDEVDSFFKAWLRAKYAETTRERKKGAVNRDYENIGQFHRWVHDNKERIGLENAQDFYDFITQQLDRFAGYYIAMRQASLDLIPGREEIYYNAYLYFTSQYMLALAPLKLEDNNETVLEKIRLVTTFLDIYIARRIVNSRRIVYDTVRDTMFKLMKTIRNKDVSQLRTCLLGKLMNEQDTFTPPVQLSLFDSTNNYKPYRLKKTNRRQMRYLLARITSYIEQQSNINTNFRTYTDTDAKGKLFFEIEHIWADKYEQHRDEFAREDDFQDQRNDFGGLILLPRGTNQSFGAAVYENKVQYYLRENLLAASLHLQTYEQNPNFKNFMRRSGLPFEAHEQFKRSDLEKRHGLYRQICEQIWNPDRLLGR